MAKETKPTPQKTKDESKSVLMAEETFALEYEDDKKTMRIAIVLAIVFHIIFFLIKVPEMVAEAQEA